MDYLEKNAHKAFFGDKDENENAVDLMWYLWSGPKSPLFGKDKAATFERYLLDDKETHKEKKNPYYICIEQENFCNKILEHFGVDVEEGHIINGHVPVKAKNGETPLKAGGKAIVIDGGFSKAYQETTGIAGYTLVYHSRGFQLVQHEPFMSAQDAILRGLDIKSTTQLVELSAHRMLVADTDKGEELRAQVEDLRQLLYAYRHGILKERK